MKLRYAGFSIPGVVLLLAAALPAWAHPNLSGHWVLIPAQSTYNGQPATETGDITIEQHDRQLLITRHLSVDGAAGGMHFDFTTDGHEGTTVYQGKEMKTKATWHGDRLTVRTTTNGEVTTEEYHLDWDHGQLFLTVQRPDGQTSTLVFRRE